MIRKHLFWDYLGRFSNLITQFITSIVLTRLLTPEDFGIVGIAMAINGVVGIFGNFGFSSFLIQQKEENDETTNSIFWFSSLLAILLGFITIISSPFVAEYYMMVELVLIIKVTSLSLVLSLISSTPNALLTKRLLFKEINLRNITVAIISGLLGITLAIKGFGVWSLVYQQLTSSVLGFVLSFRLAHWFPKLIFNWTECIKSYHFGKYIFLAGLFDGIYSRIDVFMIGKLFSLANLGLFTRAKSLDKTITGVSGSSLLNVLFPALAKIKDDETELVKSYNKYYEHICFAFCLLAAVTFLSATPAFYHIFGEEWVKSAGYFKIIVLSGFAYPLSSLMLSIIEARGNSKNFFKADVIKKFVFLPSYIVVYLFTIDIYLIVLFFINIVGTGINLWFLNKEINIGYSTSIRVFTRYFSSSVILAVIVDLILPSNHLIVPAILKIVLVIIVYVIVSHKTKSNSFQLVLNFIKSRI